MKYVTAVAHGRDGCARGERQQPAPRSSSARSSARAEAMRPTSAYSAATARVADSICECVRGFLRGLEVEVALAIGGGRQAQETNARHAATADAARAEHESGGAAGPGVLGCDVRGGTSACVVDAACGFGP